VRNTAAKIEARQSEKICAQQAVTVTGIDICTTTKQPTQISLSSPQKSKNTQLHHGILQYDSLRYKVQLSSN